VLAAWKAGTWIDRGIMAISVVGFSVPVCSWLFVEFLLVA